MKKKGLAIVLSAILVTSQVILGAELSEGTKLQSVIESVKKKIVIPSDLTEFNYNIAGNKYQFDWYDEARNESINIEAKEDAQVLNYQHYKNEEKSMLAQTDYEMAKQEARTFLRKVAPEYEKNLVLKQKYTPSKDDTYHLTYLFQQEGIKVFGKEAYVEVDKKTGEVTGFSGIDYDEHARYEKPQALLTLEDAQTHYLAQIGMDLSYQTYNSYEEKDTLSFLTYKVSNGAQKGISASTGEVLEPYDEVEDSQKPIGNEEVAQDSSTESSAGTTGLTPSEQKAVDESEDFLSAEELKSKWEMSFGGLESMNIAYSNLYQSKTGYLREIVCHKKSETNEQEEARLCVDAVTGELVSYRYIPVSIGTKKYKEWTTEQAHAFLVEVAPDKANQVAFKMVNVLEAEETQQFFVYERQANGLPVSGDGIYLVYDTARGQVTRYDTRWSETSFKKPEGILSQEEVVKYIGLELVYMETDKNHYELAYNHDTFFMQLDAWTGKVVDYDGEEKIETVQGLYTDIKGHPQAAIITKLFNSGIYLNKAELKPDQAVTQQELLALLVRSKRWGEIREDRIYEEAYRLGLLEEKDKTPNQGVTKEEGMSYLIKLAGYEKVANLGGIYQYPYEDKDVSDSKKGSIAIAYGFGWLEKTDYFRPKDELTRAEAMVYLYRELSSNL